MTDPADLGSWAVNRIAELWEIGDTRVRWTEDGFDWWPGSFRVSVSAHRAPPEWNLDGHRLTVMTSFLTDVGFDEPTKRNLVSSMAALSPSYAWVFAPSTVDELFVKYETPIRRDVRFQSTMYLREDNSTWVPDLLAGLAILQPIDAERQADPASALLDATPNGELPAELTVADPAAQILDSVTEWYVADGAAPSRWAGSAEFAAIAEKWGRNDRCFGLGDSTGLTLETPIGSSSALIQLHTDVRHPAYGTGLLASLQLPHRSDRASITDQCQYLNFLEASMWSGIPQLASWQPKQIGSDLYHSANGIFIPNALFRPGLAEQAALWQVERAAFVKQQLWPELSDSTMLEILTARTTVDE